jgi:hypothetical protein
MSVIIEAVFLTLVRCRRGDSTRPALAGGGHIDHVELQRAGNVLCRSLKGPIRLSGRGLRGRRRTHHDDQHHHHGESYETSDDEPKVGDIQLF